MTRHLLVIGAQRCGTTYLHDLLAAHPQIAMATPARPEPKVFLDEELSARGLEWYRRTYFPHATDEPLLGEKSTSYLEHPEAGDRGRRMLGDPLIVVQLRDPVDRAISHWAFSSDSGLETRPLEEALAANLEGPLPWDPALTSVSPYAYLERGRYVDQILPWVDRFADDLIVVFLDELVGAPDVVGDLYERLGVDRSVRPAHMERPVNESRQEHGGISDMLRGRLRAYFADSDRRLSELLRRPLPWGGPTA